MNDVIKILVSCIVALFVIGFAYTLWQIGRTINYSFSYEDMVVDTIRKTVKQECLK